MSSADMVPPSLTADGDDEDPPDATEGPEEPGNGGPGSRRRRRWWAWGLGAGLLVGAVLGVLFVPTPYVLLEPGSVRAAEDRIDITGSTTFEEDADVLFTTVFVDRATLAGLLRSRIDEAIEVRTQEEVYGPRGRDESQRVNRQQMDLSKLVATKEALEYLGYEAAYSGDGALVTEVVEGGPSEGRLRAGDVIVAVGDTPVGLPADLRSALDGRAPGDTVPISVRRSSAAEGENAASADPSATPSTVEVALGESEEEPGRAVLGVAIEPLSPHVDSEVEVSIDSGAVTGPSAGLAWSLAIIDRLTPGSLAGDGDVAVTGEILDDGRVGVIGGVVQKVATVKRNGIHTFLYPADTSREEQERMKEIAGDDLELVPVATLDEAVRHLAPQGVEAPGAPG